jgi:hypothetical protein
MSYGTYTVIDRYRSQEQTVKLAKAGCLATLSNVRFKHPWLCARRIVRSSRPQEIFQPPQQGFYSVHAQLQLLGNIFQLFTPHLTSPQLTSHFVLLTI